MSPLRRIKYFVVSCMSSRINRLHSCPNLKFDLDHARNSKRLSVPGLKSGNFQVVLRQVRFSVATLLWRKNPEFTVKKKQKKKLTYQMLKKIKSNMKCTLPVLARGITKGARRHNCPGSESLWGHRITKGDTEWLWRTSKSPHKVTTFFNTVHLLLKDLSFEHGERQTWFLPRTPANLVTPFLLAHKTLR